ncbi:Cytochrome c-type biogenesis CcmH-like mitochondrial protein [Linum perenne]
MENKSDDEVKNSRIMEARRARSISHNVRCTECWSQSIEDSQADIVILPRKIPLQMYCWMNMGLQKAQVEYQCAYHGAKVREGCRTYFEREGDDARDSNASSPGTITSSELVEKVDSVIDDEYVS